VVGLHVMACAKKQAFSNFNKCPESRVYLCENSGHICVEACAVVIVI
jgi:hypothetical protein